MTGMRIPPPTIIIPVKRSAIGKSRLRAAVPPATEVIDDLVRSIALDTIAAAGALDVDVLVVTDDPEVTAAAAGLDARILADPPGAGLNEAIRHGETAVGLDRPRVALTADLPALRPEELAAALAAAPGGERAFLADHHGIGTTLLWAPAGVPLRPLFGGESARAHAESGARPLTGDWPSLRLDVDTAADLRAAAEIGLGERTALRAHMVISDRPVTAP
jgi:2-phospho-L-lactate/phosphoenolpyruvate guanylyltransferase